MNPRTLSILGTTLAALCCSPALADPAIDWYTIDCGGGRLTGGALTLSGTVGQPDASSIMSGGIFTLTGGFWAAPPLPPSCPADFNGSGTTSVQDIFDFLAAYFGGESRADFNASGVISVQDIFDFLAAYFAGCP